MGKIKKILENELVGGTQNTDVYPVTSIKAVYDEKNERLDHILKRRGVVNVSTNYNDDHIAEVLTLTQAIAKIPSNDRVLGFTMTFLTSEGWKTYQFTGDSISDWSVFSNWENIPNANILYDSVGSLVGLSENRELKLLNKIARRGYYISGEGTIGTNGDYGYIKEISCSNIKAIRYNRAVRRHVFYDSEGSIMSYVENVSDVVIPEGAVSMALNVSINTDIYVVGILYKSARISSIPMDIGNIAEVTEYTTVQGMYISRAGVETSGSANRVIHTVAVKGLETYLINLISLGNLATDLAFYDEDGKHITNSGPATSTIKNVIIVTPKRATIMKISTIDIYTPRIYKVKDTGLLSSYLDEMSQTEYNHYTEVTSNINNINKYNSHFVLAGPELLTESGYIRVADGTIGSNQDFICSPFLPILPGSNIGTVYTPGNTSGYAFYSAPNEESFISGTQEPNHIKVPDNALYFRVSSEKGTTFYIGYLAASLGSVAKLAGDSVINYDIRFPDLMTGFIEIAHNTVAFRVSTTDGFKCTLIRCFENQSFMLNTIGGSGTAKAYQFFDKNGESLLASTSARVEEALITAPKGAYYLAVNVKLSEMTTAEEDFYLKSTTPSQKEIDSLSAIVRSLSATVNSTVIDYTTDNLIAGNLNTYPVGNPANTGALKNYKYGIFPCTPGITCVITTFGGYNTAKGLGFIDKDNNIIYSSDGGQLVNKSFVAPEGTVKVGVNLDIDESSVFSLRLYSLGNQVEENTKNIKALQEKLSSPIDSIPLWYGKDMFFIKDTPLDFYAKSVLLKNYPKYQGVYVNHAPITATGKNYDFNLPVINHIAPEGKVYFNDGAKVDIYADNGELYKDHWNVVKDIQVHTTDVSTKEKSVKVMCIGSSATEIGMATYVKKYLETLGVTMIGCGSKRDYLGTKSEGYYGWSNEQLCGKIQNAKTYPQTGTTATNPFMKLATPEDKANYPDYCFTYVEGSIGSRQSYAEATDKDQDFYIFDFAWYLQTRQVETPDVVFFILGTNGSINNYGIYMPWIVNRIIQACPNAYIGINLGQAYRLQSDVDTKLDEMGQKLAHLYNYVDSKGYDKMKVVSLHVHQSPDFSHNFSYESGENINTSKAIPVDGFLHMDNNGYLQDAKCIGAYIAYCLPNI
jgi:hypothetical protein